MDSILWGQREFGRQDARRGQGKPSFVVGRLLLALLLVVLAQPILPFATPVQAATLTVTKVADTNDGTCDADCSLREAIAAAASGDTITFALPGAAPWTITLALGQLTISTNLTIQGPGAASLTISGDNAVQVFRVNSGVTATFSGLIIANGRAVSGNPSGGGILNVGTLTISDSVIRDNYADYGGGGILNGGMLTLNNTIIENNETSGSGGGISNIGTATTATVILNNSLVQDNTASGDGGGVHNYRGSLTINGGSFTNNTALAGGAIDTDGQALISQTTIAGNHASRGGGIQIYQYALTSFILRNSTLSNNAATSDGGGLKVTSYTATPDLLAVQFTTITGNSAGGNGGGISTQLIQPGSIETATTSGIVLLGTIVAGNTATSAPMKPDCAGSLIASQGHNLVGTGSDCPTNGTGDIAYSEAIDAVLNTTLADNGGPTKTHALVANSPALDAADATACADPAVANGHDQRGTVRPQGSGCDIGAFELIVAAPSPSPSPSPSACVSPFTDVPNSHVACPAIAALANQGVIFGYTADGCAARGKTSPCYGPDDPVQRAQGAAFLVRALDWQGQPTGPRTFTDFDGLVEDLRRDSLIIANQCATTATTSCVAQGYGDGRFGPIDSVSYAQVIAFIARAFARSTDFNWVTQPVGSPPYQEVPAIYAGEIATYHHYAGTIPAAPSTAAGWNAPAPREWIARVLYQALNSAP